MKISILGSNGFLSNAIGRYANAHGWKLDMYGLEKPEGLRYDAFHEINLMDKELDCTSMLDSDIIVYAIGAGIQYNLNEGANLIYALNVAAPMEICSNLRTHDYKGIFVTFGSYFELGEASMEHPATEFDIINALAPAPTDYVVSKRVLTRFVASYKHDFTHWHFILPTIYGPGENPKRLIPYTINAIKNGEELHLTSGNQVRQYLYVDNVASVLASAYEASLPSGIYNIEGTDTFSVRQIVELIFASFNHPLPDNCFGEIERFDEGMKYLSLDGIKLKSILHSKNFVPIKDVINLY